MFHPLEPPLQGQQIPQILQGSYRKLIKQALPLRNQIRHIRRCYEPDYFSLETGIFFRID
jgi:hypothetical protein